MNELLVGVACALGIGTGDIGAARLSRQIGSLVAAFWTGLVGCPILAAYLVLAGQLGVLASLADPAVLGWVALAGVLSTGGYITFFSGLCRSSAGLVSAMASTSPLVVLAVGIGLGLETLAVGAALGAGLIVVGIVLLLVEEARSQNAHSTNLVAIRYALLAALCWGLELCVIGFALPDTDPVAVVFSTRLFAVLSLAVVLCLSPQQPRGESRWSHLRAAKSPRTWAAIVATGATQTGVLLIYSMSAHMGNILIVAAIMATSPMVTASLAHVFLKERLTGWQIAAIVLSVAGVLVLGSRG